MSTERNDKQAGHLTDRDAMLREQGLKTLQDLVEEAGRCAVLSPLPEPDLGMPWRVNAKSDGSVHSSGFTYGQMNAHYLKGCNDTRAALAAQQTEPAAPTSAALARLEAAAGLAAEVLEKHRQHTREYPMGGLGANAAQALKAALRELWSDEGDEAQPVSHPAQQAAEPWGWAIVDKRGNARDIRPRVEEFFGVSQPQEAFNAEDVAKLDREWAGLVPHSIVTLYAGHAPAAPQAAPVAAPDAMKVVIAALHNDPDYAWSWHCNAAMAAFDVGVPHYQANQAAARFMRFLADVDTAKHPGFPTPPPAAAQGELSFEDWCRLTARTPEVGVLPREINLMRIGWQAALASRAVQPMSGEQRAEVFRRADARMVYDINLSWRNAVVEEVEVHHGINQPQLKQEGGAA